MWEEIEKNNIIETAYYGRRYSKSSHKYFISEIALCHWLKI